MTESDEDSLANLLNNCRQTCLKRQRDGGADAFGIDLGTRGRSGAVRVTRDRRYSRFVFDGEEPAGELGGLGQRTNRIEDLGGLKRLLDDGVAPDSPRLRFVERLQ